MAINETYLGNPTTTSKELYTRDLTDYYSKHLLTQPTSSYESSEKQMANVNPLWWMSTLVVSNTYRYLPDFITYFTLYDEKFFLRAGALHTEMGEIYPELIEAKDIPQPGENLVTPRAQYLKILQEESGKKSIYIRTHVDKRYQDHASRFHSFLDYAKVMSFYITVLTRANNLFIRSMFAGMLMGMSGGAIFFNEDTNLEVLFQPKGKTIAPTEEWSKQASQFYKSDGNIKKQISDLAGECFQKFKNRGVFDPNILITEADLLKQDYKLPELTDIRELKFPDISDEQKTKKWLKSMYSKKDANDNKERIKGITRQKSLWGLMEAVNYKITRMVLTNSRENHMGFDTSRNQVNSDSNFDFPMLVNRSDLVVFLNSDDYLSLTGLSGSLESGIFNGMKNPGLQRISEGGTKIFGVPYFLPGSFLILHKDALKVITYLDRIDKEEFKFHLVETWIRHTMMKVVFFKDFPGFFGTMKEFQPNPVWLSKHVGFWKDAN